MSTHIAQRVFQVVHVVALSAWFGTVGMSGIVAATVFPIVGRMKPTLAAYPDYTGDHALLAGGLIAGKVFLIVDSVQFVCAAIALASFVTMIVAGYSMNTLVRVLRSVVLLMTMGLLSYHLFVLMPGMTEDLRNYWDFAAAGNTEQAEIHKNAFFAYHTTASNSLKALMGATLLCLVLAVWTGVGSGGVVKTNKPSTSS